MKILVLTGSPHTQGTTALLADEFCEGAKESGHEIFRIDAAKSVIHPCLACDKCCRNNGQCAYDDDMYRIIPNLLESDAVVLVSPLYYFGVTSQLKKVIDRFYSVNSQLRENRKKLCLIAAGADIDAWAMDGVKAHYKCLCNYLHWEEGGMILGFGLATRQDAEDSHYKEKARNLGREI